MSEGTAGPVGIVLAAGRGTRMRSRRPKVLHAVGGRPMLGWVLEAAREAGCRRRLVVVGHGGEEVRAAFAGSADLTWVEQPEPRGTGDALARAVEHLDGSGLALVLSGDAPLISPASLRQLLERAGEVWGAMAVARPDEPGDLGRVVQSSGGSLERIVEAADASEEERALDLVNAGFYALPVPGIAPFLEALEPSNVKGELYLTDALTAAAAAGESIALVPLADPAEALGINDRRDLARVHLLLLARKATELMAGGVTLLDPERTVVEPGVEVGGDTVIHPGVSLLGATRIGPGCVIGQGAWLRDTALGEAVVVEAYSVLDGARVEAGCRVGPFARLRPGAELGAGARVGNFVELKNARLGEGAKANHLSYLGDATVGEGANVGAGVVTCNYDGVRKHRTEIGPQAFIGSDTMLVAPVRVGDRATTAAGSVITREVPDGALGVGRARQRNLPGWSRRGRRED